MLKTIGHDPIALSALVKVFNKCLSKGLYPWHNSIITPIFKSGDQYNPDNYRAIAVSSCLGKTFSTILLNRLKIFRSECCDDPIYQLGFREGAQTNDHLLTLKTIIDKYRKRKSKKLYTCFVDLKKAFDTVSRQLLLYKLTNLNITGPFFDVLNNMYNNSTAKIKINNLLSEKFCIEKGTEQGHPLSPELFKIFIRDFSSALDISGQYPQLVDTTVNHLLWADDLVLLALDAASLQRNINILNDYCIKWGLSVNIKKTKIMIFGTNSRSKIQNFTIGKQNIEQVDKYCYLGVVIHKNGNFTTAVNELRKKALRGLFGLKKIIVKQSLSFDALAKLFDYQVPVLIKKQRSTVS